MCGISGIVNLNKAPVNRELLKKMTDTMTHRGPDGEGFWLNKEGNTGFGHRRLAIIDLSENGKQPMSINDRLTITYNGELYNYKELRQELKGKGCEFKSESDTEVILHAYQIWGENSLQRFDGMFAFAIWDETEKSLFCGRDRFGEKPFYYTFTNQYFTFASEIKALQVFSKHSPDNEMVYNYLQYDVLSLYYDKSKTFYSNVLRLDPAHYLKIDYSGKIEKKQYWKLKKDVHPKKITEAAEEFHEALYNSVKYRLRSDVAVGSSLSGGLDSSSIVMAMKNAKINSKQKTFSARFQEKELDEGQYIEAVNRAANTEGHQVYPKAEGLIEQFEKLFFHQEEPFGSAGIYAQWEVMKLAKNENVTVLLDGQGADEILAGYPRYYQTYFRWLFKHNRKKFASEVKAYNEYKGNTLQFDSGFIFRSYFPEIIEVLGKIKRNKLGLSNEMKLNREFHLANKNDQIPFKSIRSLKDDLYFSTVEYGLDKLLRYSDKNSMAHSREVRLPFLSHQLVEFVFSLPDNLKLNKGRTKYTLREAMKHELPKEVLSRKDKVGYEPPQEKWMQHPKMQDLLSDARAFALKEQIISDKSVVTNWQLLMLHQLHQNAKR